jgi:chromosome segregation ATPase
MLKLPILGDVSRYLAVGALAAVFTFGVACSDDDDDGVNVPPTIEDRDGQPPAGELDDEREDFVREAREQVDGLEERIDELEADAQTKSGDEREEAEEQIDNLRGKVDDLNDKIRDIELTSDSDSYEDLKSDVESALGDVRSELEDLEDSLGF